MGWALVTGVQTCALPISGRLGEGPARRGDGGLGVLDAGLGRVLDQLTRGRVVRGVGLPWIDQLAIDEQELHGSSPCDRAGRGPGTPDNRRPCARNYRMRTTLSCDATHALPRQTQDLLAPQHAMRACEPTDPESTPPVQPAAPPDQRE